MSSAPGATPQAATVEDYDSDTSEAIDGSRTVAVVATAVASKRKPTSKPPTNAASPDVGSDSGYSSRTAATAESAGTTQSPSKNSSSATSRFEVGHLKAETPVEGTSKKDRSAAAAKAPPRPPSGAQRRQSDSRRCSDPECRRCLTGFSPAQSPLDSPWNLSLPPQYPHTPQSYSPYPSPMAHGPHLMHYYPQAVPTIAPPQPRRRPPSMHQYRPSSYHAAMGPPGGYWPPPAAQQQASHPPPLHPPPHAIPQQYSPYEPRPPSSAGHAHSAGLTPSYGFQEGQYVNMSYFPSPSPRPQSISPAMHHARPPLQHHASDRPLVRGRPMSMYMPQLATYDQPVNEHGAMIRLPSQQRPSSRQQNLDYGAQYVDRQRMPPPTGPIQAPRHRSRKLSHSNGAIARGYSDSDGDSFSDCSTCSEENRSSPKKDRSTGPSTNQPKPTAYSARRSSSTSVPRPGSRGRRNSYMGHESHAETERRRNFAAAEAYQDDVSGRRPSVTTQSSRKPSPSKQPLALPSKEHPRNQSHSRSRRSSSREGNPTTSAKPGGNDGFRIRVDAREGFNVEFSGAMDGKMISMAPAEGGMAELTIGDSSSPRKETKYRSGSGSSKGSTKSSRQALKPIEGASQPATQARERRQSKTETKKLEQGTSES